MAPRHSSELRPEVEASLSAVSAKAITGHPASAAADAARILPVKSMEQGEAGATTIPVPAPSFRDAPKDGCIGV